MTDSLRPTRPTTTEDDDDSGQDHIRGGWTEAQKQADAASTWAQRFVPEQNLKVIKFQTDAPYASFRRHWVDRTGPNGPYKMPFTCLDTVGKACPLCDAGNKAASVAAFSVLELGDDGQMLVRTWDLGPKLLNVLKGWNNDPKVGPLTRGFFGVNKTQAQGGNSRRSGGTTQTNVVPIKGSQLLEDYGINPPSAAEIANTKPLDSSIIQVPTTSELREVAAELVEDD